MTDDDAPQMRSYRGLQMWTIYDHPSDFPDYFVARVCLNGIPRDHHHTFETEEELEEMREKFRQRGMVRIERHPTDDPVIMEVWL